MAGFQFTGFDEDIPEMLAARQRRLISQAKNRPVSGVGSGNQSTWSSLISELGGAGGATGGAAAGAALGSIVPGLGTAIGGVIGAGVGGFLGGTGGRLAENQIRDNEMRAGDALKEGAMSGAFGAAGQGFQAVRGLQAVGKAGGAKGIGAVSSGSKVLGSIEDDAARIAAEKAIMGGKRGGMQLAKELGMGGDDAAKGLIKGSASKLSQSSFADAWGTKAGLKVNGRILSPEDATKANRFIIDKLGVKTTASADDVLGAAFDTQKATGSQIGELIAQQNAKLGTKQINPLVKEVEGKLSRIAGLDPQKNTWVQNTLKQLKSTKDLSSLHNLRLSIDDGLNFARNSNAAEPLQQQAAEAFREAIGGYMKKNVKNLADLQDLYAGATRTVDLVASSAAKPRGVNILNNRIGGGITQRVKAGVGRAADRVAGMGAGEPGIVSRGLSSVPGQIAKGTVTRGVANQLMQPQDPQSLEEAMLALEGQSWPNNMTTSTNMTNPNNSQPNIDQLSQADDQMSSDSPFAVENVQANVQNMLAQGASMKDVKEYLGIVQTIKALQPESKEPKLNATQQQQASNSLSGLQDIELMRSALQRDPQLGLKNSLPGGGFTRRLTGTTDYEAARQNVADVIGRLRSGGAINRDEEARFLGQLPGAFDSPEAATQKLARVQSLLERFAYPQVSAPTLEEALMAYGGGQDSLPY